MDLFDKKELYSMIIRQLRFHGFHEAASVISDESHVVVAPDEASNELSRLVYLGNMVSEGRMGEAKESVAAEDGVEDQEPSHQGVDFDRDVPPGLSGAAPLPNYSTFFTATHKGSCRTIAFSVDGKFVSTGSSDNSIKVLEVSKMKKDVGEEKPVIRTFYGHTDAINDLAFHPNGVILASCSKDCYIKLYDLSKPTARHAFRFLKHPNDVHNVRSISFHPSGDFILAASEHESIRLYDVNSFVCYVSPHASDNHRGAINQIRYSPQGQFYATAGKDGTVKIWDTVTSRCFRQIEQAHGGSQVSCVTVSRNSKYLLTTGKDSMTKLWEVTSGKMVMAYEGAKNQQYRLQSVFADNENLVLCGDEATNNVIIWDARTGALVQSLSGHTNVVRALASSPTDGGFVSGSEDFRARYWNVDQSPL